MLHFTNRVRQLTAFAGLALLVGTAGCSGGRHPVTGKVVFDDGSPLEEGSVAMEMREGNKPIMARGTIEHDGTFQMGTEKPGDGAKPGKYRVLVVPQTLTEREAATMPPVIDKKFERFETSGLEFEVKEGKNELKLTVTRPEEGRGLYPVRGIVTLEDDTPVTQGAVVFEHIAKGDQLTARGLLQADGSYQLGPNKFGIPVGKYRVRINPLRSGVPGEKQAPSFDSKYTKFETSGLEYEVKAEPNEIPIKLAKAKEGG